MGGFAVLITDLLDSFRITRNPSLRYLESLRRTQKRAAIYGLSETCQLTNESVNGFLSSSADLSAETISNIRREICTLWRFAYEIQAIDTLPTRVRRVKVVRAAARAWSMQDLLRMLDCAQRDDTRLSSRVRMRVCDVLPSWIRVGYETGLRFSDVLSLTEANVYNSSVVLSEAKTGKTCVCPISPEAEESLATLLSHSPDGTYWLWCMPRRRAFCVWRDFLNRHGFSGSARWLRRSAATYIEREKSGGATVFLRHSAPHLARVHYIDATLLTPPQAPPPIRLSAG